MDNADVVTFDRVKQIIERDGLEKSTAKTIRSALEECAGLKPGDLKPRKTDIANMIDEVLSVAPKERAFSCTARNGQACPKNIKSAQAKNTLTVPEFLGSGKRITIDVDGNTLTGEPRAFSSGNLGWFLTGKIEIDICGQPVWAQVGMNITIPGSQSWSK